MFFKIVQSFQKIILITALEHKNIVGVTMSIS